MFEHKFCRLKPFWQLAPYCLFYHPWSTEADQGPWFGEDDIAEGAEACQDAGCTWIGQDGDVQQIFPGKLCQLRACLCHLHQRQRALHHPGPARGRDDDQGQPSFHSRIYKTCDLFPDHRSHTTTDEAEVHNPERNTLPIHPAYTRLYGRALTRPLFGIFETVGIAFPILKLKRIDGG